jgi:potassium-dependent mechanosensitive channel
MLRLLTLIFALWMVGPTVTLAQQPTGTQVSAGSEALLPDYDVWEVVATRAEDAIAAGRASNTAFDQLRAELASWRSRFLSAQGINSARIATLREQIAALGDPPADGQSEPQEISDRRGALNEQLSRLQAPVLTAEEAYRRADGLIGEIDALIRNRQTEEILELGPSPLNPVHWTAGLNALRGTAFSLW